MKVCVQKIIIAAQLLLSIVALAVIVSGMASDPSIDLNGDYLIINKTLALVADVLFFIICGFAVSELFFVAKKPPIIRLVSMFIFLIVTIVMCIDTPAESGMPAVFVGSIVYSIMLIVALVKCPNKVENNIKKIVIPNMFSNTFDFVFFLIAVAPVSIVAIIVISFFSISSQSNMSMAIRFFGIYLLLLVVYLFVVFLIFPLKVLSYEKTLDYNKLQKYLFSCYKSKISDEKRAYLQCFEVNYLYAIDKGKADKLFLSIVPPKKSLTYITQYKLIELVYLLNNDHQEEFSIKLKEAQNTIPTSQKVFASLLKNLFYMQKAIDGTITIDDLNTFFPDDSKKRKFIYLNNIYIRATYFTKINDDVQAAHLKQILSQFSSQLPELQLP